MATYRKRSSKPRRSTYTRKTTTRRVTTKARRRAPARRSTPQTIRIVLEQAPANGLVSPASENLLSARQSEGPKKARF